MSRDTRKLPRIANHRKLAVLEVDMGTVIMVLTARNYGHKSHSYYVRPNRVPEEELRHHGETQTRCHTSQSELRSRHFSGRRNGRRRSTSVCTPCMSPESRSLRLVFQFFEIIWFPHHLCGCDTPIQLQINAENSELDPVLHFCGVP